MSLEVPLETEDPSAPLWATVAARLPEEITTVGDDGDRRPLPLFGRRLHPSGPPLSATCGARQNLFRPGAAGVALRT